MALDLSQFTPEQIASLKSQLDGLAPGGRSPFRDRQLTDLRLRPTADDPRPTFFWSAEEPRNAPVERPPYRRLMWESTTGREITVKSPEEQATYTAQGFVLIAPANAEAPDMAEQARQALAQLSPEDRKLVMEAAHDARLAKVKDLAAALSPEELDALRASLEPKVQKRSA